MSEIATVWPCEYGCCYLLSPERRRECAYCCADREPRDCGEPCKECGAKS